MPSIEAVEQFKTIVQGLAREPEVRAQMGLPPEEILPPESQLDDDLADLLGGMPTGDDGAAPAEAPEPDPVSADLDDLFAAPVPDHDEPAVGPSLDDLLGPAPAAPEPAAEAEADPFADLFGSLPAPDEADPFGLGEPEPGPEPEAEIDTEPAPLDFGPAAEEIADEPSFDSIESLDSFDAEPVDDLAGLDDFGFPGGDVAPAEPGRRSTEGVSPEDLDDAFFETPGEDLFGTAPSAPSGPAEDDEFEFGDGMSGAEFPELAGFADTKEEDVEAFDAMGEADEFQLGDFESQFGITADDHTDAELLNPAQALDLESAGGQRSLSLSEADFATVQKALGRLPLNLRLAVEELIGEKEVSFDDLEKVVRLLVSQAPARILAAAVGKILGRKIVIPPGFEKGTGADLEAQHGTLWYNIRTIMFPVLKVAGIASVAAAILVLLGWNFLLRPWKANDLYEKGLVAARQDDGARADDLFVQAWYYWPVQDRFFQYADAYQDTGDYDRARRKYLELLKPSVKPFRDEDKPKLDQLFSQPLAPLPPGLEGTALTDRLAAKKAALNAYYDYVTRLLSANASGADLPAAGNDIPGEVVLGNPDTRGILDYSRFETDFGFDGRDKTAHFRRADAILKTLLADHPGSKEGLLRKSDNFLAWSKALSSKASLDDANTALSEYLRLYGYDAAVTWRFVKVFLLEDQESELLKFRERISADKKMAMDGETMAQLAGWFLDRHDSVAEQGKVVTLTQKTLEEEYGVRPKVVDPSEAVEKARSATTTTARSLPLAEGEAAAAGAEGSKAPELKPPFKYPNTSQPYQPDYLDKVDTLLLRAMDTQKTLPELHWQLSRFYRASQAQADEQRALAAADTYFQRLAPRLTRLGDRPVLRVATSNRIGEIFDAKGEPLQAEKYYLDALRSFEAFRAQGLVALDTRAALVYRNLGNLYYRQTPGVDSAGKTTSPGGWDQALKLYETAESGHLEDPTVTFRLGVIHYEKQEFGAAVQKFFALDRPGNLGESSGRQNPNLLYAMGNALFRSGNFAAAEGYYRELLDLLGERRSKITDWDPAGRSAHKALAQRLYEAWNNLAAAQYRASNSFRSGTPEFRQAIASLTTARAQAQILGRDLFENKNELDITTVDAAKLQAIRDDEAQILAKTRQEKGLVEANFQVLSMIETVAPSRREALAQRLEIFARLPLELDQTEAP